MNLAASVIVKNELGRYLQECVASLREFCDLICVCDDGSTDRTGEWLDDNADDQLRVMHLDPDDAFFAGDESRRRQALMDFTFGHNPDVVLAIDADEFVSDGHLLRHVTMQARPAWTLQMEEVWGVDRHGMLIRVDGGWRPHPVPIMYRRPTGGDTRHWRINPKPLACGREPLAVRRLRAKPSGVTIFHLGWACKADRQARFDRYVVADGGRYHANSHLLSIMFADEQVSLTSRRWPEFLVPRKAALTERILREGS